MVKQIASWSGIAKNLKLILEIRRKCSHDLILGKKGKIWCLQCKRPLDEYGQRNLQIQERAVAQG